MEQKIWLIPRNLGGAINFRPPRAPWGPLDSTLMNEMKMKKNEVFTLLIFLKVLKGHLVLQGAPSGF